MSKRTLIALLIGMALLILALGWAAREASAQPTVPPDCAPRPEIVDWLDGDFNEMQRFTGTMENGGLTTIFELWFDEEAGTFTVLETYTDGISCIRTFGDNATLYAGGTPA